MCQEVGTVPHLVLGSTRTHVDGKIAGKEVQPSSYAPRRLASRTVHTKRAVSMIAAAV